MKTIILIMSLLLSFSIRAENTFKVIIPFPPGGGADTAFKHFQKYTYEKYKFNLIPIYKPGGDSLIGLKELSESPTDGSVFGITTVSGLATFKIKYPDYNFNNISLLGKTVMALVVNSENDIENLDDLEREIKSSSKRNYGVGAPAQKIAMTQLFEINNVTPPDFITYKGAAPLINNLLGNHIDTAMVPLSLVSSQIDSGKLKLIATTSNQYTPSLKNRYPSWETHEGFVFTLPENSSKFSVNKWSEIVRNYLNDSDTKSYWNDKFLEYSIFGSKYVDESVNSAILSVKKQISIRE